MIDLIATFADFKNCTGRGIDDKKIAMRNLKSLQTLRKLQVYQADKIINLTETCSTQNDEISRFQAEIAEFKAQGSQVTLLQPAAGQIQRRQFLH